MTPEMFDELLQRLASKLQKSDTNWRKALDPELKLAVTLRHIESGDKYASLSYDFRVARTTKSLFIPDVCEVIVKTFSEEVIPIPNTPEEWRPIGEEFERRWNDSLSTNEWSFPLIIGATVPGLMTSLEQFSGEGCCLDPPLGFLLFFLGMIIKHKTIIEFNVCG
jgi:hypothetical protein